MPNFRYKAVRIRQTETGDYLVLFAAPATEIDLWVGVPQKKELSDQEETTGFQREENEKRIKELGKFYNNERNIIQNPLLCARRRSTVGEAAFESIEQTHDATEHIEHGFVSIKVEALEAMSLLQLLTLVKEDLERRVEGLRTAQVPEQRILQLKTRARVQTDEGDAQNADDDNAVELSDDADVEPDDTSAEDMAIVLDETHIYDFWEQIAARVRVLGEIGDAYTQDNFEGFTKEAMISFLRPVVLVDGQHRLRGAIRAAQETATNDPKYQTEIEDRIINQENPTDVQSEIETRISRKLPVSLLMSDDPAEQVFQFIVVNQKAVPIGKALLGTIVSTSLSNEELGRVSERLRNAGIELDESRVVAFLTRSQNSPFNGLVEKGLTADSKDLLPWSVLRSLAAIFQNLQGGRLFHSRIDYAAKWRRDFLENSGTITEWNTKGCETAFEYWSSADGPWREVFITFWASVRDKMADTSDPEAKNHWGAARKSQIFNKISLTILAADFFQFLCDTKNTVADVQAVPGIVDEWLDGVAPNYFARHWNLSGLKRDSTGVRNRWSKLWEEYRKDPIQLPRLKEYRHLAVVDRKSYSQLTTSSLIN